MRASLGRSGSIYDPSGDIFNPSGHLPRRMSGSHPSLNTMGTSRPRSATSGPSSIQAFANSGLNWSGSSLAYTPEANSPVPPQVQGFSRNSSFDTVSAHGQMFLKTPTPPPSGNGGIAANNRFSVSSVRANELGGPTNTEEEVQYLLLQAIDLTQNESLRHGLQKLMEVEFNGLVRFDRADSAEIYRTVVSMEGFLWKKGKALHLLGKRYYLLSGNCMYYYNHKNDIRPKGVVFLMGSIIEKLRDDDMEIKGYYGFEILHQDLCTGIVLLLYVHRICSNHDFVICCR